jgi:hypothetical protein
LACALSPGDEAVADFGEAPQKYTYEGSVAEEDLKIDVTRADAPTKHVAYLDLDPGEAVVLNAALRVEPEADYLTAIHAASNRPDVTVTRSGAGFRVEGVTPNGYAQVTFTAASGETVRVPVFVRNWAVGDVKNRYAPKSDNGTAATPAYSSFTNFALERPDVGTHLEYNFRCTKNHITFQYDTVLRKMVYQFELHYYPGPAWTTAMGEAGIPQYEFGGKHNDGDVNSGFPGRQRLEVTPDNTGSNTGKGTGELMTHRWKFRLTDDFKVSSDFTHLHQIKTETGDDAANPIISLTGRRLADGTSVLQLIYRGPLRNGNPSQNLYLGELPLEALRGEWIQCVETVRYVSPSYYASTGTRPEYEIRMMRMRDMRVLLRYQYDPASWNEIDPFFTYRTGNTYGRAKFSFYRRVLHLNDGGVAMVKYPGKANDEEWGAPLPEGYYTELKTDQVYYADIEVETHK